MRWHGAGQGGTDLDSVAQPTTVGAQLRANRAIGIGAAVVAAVVVFWHIDRPAVWDDEAATANAVRRPWTGLAHLLFGHDAPLVPYYVLAKIWCAIVGLVHPASPWDQCRWLSAVLAIACVGLLAGWIGSVRPAVAIVAAAVLVALPMFDRYAQEARPYSAMMLAAVWSWWQWHKLVTGRQQRGRWYAASIVALTLANPFGLIQVVAQALAAVVHRSRRAVGGMWRAMVAGLVIGAPWTVWANHHGRGPVRAHRPLTWPRVEGALRALMGGTTYSGWHVPLAGAVVSIAIVVVVRRQELAATALPWALAAPVLMPIAAIRVPLALVVRYWLSSLPGIALLIALATVTLASAIGSVLRRASPVAANLARYAVPLLVIAGVVAFAAGQQLAIRKSDGHGQDSRPAIALVSAPQLADLPLILASGHDALLIAEARPALQSRIVGFNRAVHGINIYEVPWHGQRAATTLAGHSRAVLVLQDDATVGHARSAYWLRRAVSGRLPRIRNGGVRPTEIRVLSQYGGWIVATCTLHSAGPTFTPFRAPAG